MSNGCYCMVSNFRNCRKECPELAFFKMPKKMDVALKWIEFSGREDIDLSKTYTKCSEHFSLDQIKTFHPRKLLHSGSIPFLKGPRAQVFNEIEFEYIPSNSVEIPKKDFSTSGDAAAAGPSFFSGATYEESSNNIEIPTKHVLITSGDAAAGPSFSNTTHKESSNIVDILSIKSATKVSKKSTKTLNIYLLEIHLQRLYFQF